MSQAANLFRCFNSSPEVIRLAVMMYVRFPLSLRNVEDVLFEPGDRYLSRDGAVLVEPVWADVCIGDPARACVAHGGFTALALLGWTDLAESEPSTHDSTR